MNLGSMRAGCCLWLLIAVVACAPEPRSDSLSREQLAKSSELIMSKPADLHPVEPPYTASEIRRALPVGTTWTVRIEAPNRAPEEQSVTVSVATEQSVTLSIETEKRGVIERAEVSGGWEQLVNYDVFARGGSVEEAQVDLPFGQRRCWVYTVASERDGISRKARFDFLKDQPGPPARITTWIGGRVFVTQTLQSFVVPEGDGRAPR